MSVCSEFKVLKGNIKVFKGKFDFLINPINSYCDFKGRDFLHLISKSFQVISIILTLIFTWNMIHGISFFFCSSSFYKLVHHQVTLFICFLSVFSFVHMSVCMFVFLFVSLSVCFGIKLIDQLLLYNFLCLYYSVYTTLPQRGFHELV